MNEDLHQLNQLNVQLVLSYSSELKGKDHEILENKFK